MTTPKQVVTVSTGDTLKIDAAMDSITDSTLPTVPTYPEFTAMIEAGDVVELHRMRQRAVFYKALAEGYAADVVEKNAEIERLRDFIAGVKTDDITKG